MARRPWRINPGIGIDWRMTPTELIRFFSKVEVEAVTGCWLWTAHCDGKGYGQFHCRGKTYWAHRLAYANLKGPLPDGVEVDHQEPCHRPSCINLDHLRELSHSQNSADANRRRKRPVAVAVAAAADESDFPDPPF